MYKPPVDISVSHPIIDAFKALTTEWQIVGMVDIEDERCYEVYVKGATVGGRVELTHDFVADVGATVVAETLYRQCQKRAGI